MFKGLEHKDESYIDGHSNKESGTGGTIGGGHEPAKAFALGQLGSGSASSFASGHLKP
jgi:hypothetical protein